MMKTKINNNNNIKIKILAVHLPATPPVVAQINKFNRKKLKLKLIKSKNLANSYLNLNQEL